MPGAWSWIAAAALLAQLEAAPQSNAGRLAELRELFVAAGCGERLTEQRFRGSGQPNLVCTLPGESATRIVVGAHYDKVRPGRGIADNWSGAVLLPALYADLARAGSHYTWKFVAFGDEERGERGSRAFVAELSDEADDRPVAMINLDTLGLTDTMYEPTDADGLLVELLVDTAARTGAGLTARNTGRADSSDHVPFVAAGIPSIRLHSLTGAGEHVIHGRADRYDAIDAQAYVTTYRLLTAWLAVVDASYTVGR